MRGPGAALVAFAATQIASSLAFAQAKPPSCTGSDTVEAFRQRELGLQHYRHALSQGPLDEAEMGSAVQAFDAACIAGDDTVLEPRAYALAALKRHVDAAVSLDAFLAAHPLDSLDKIVRDRVSANRPAILERVATLRITTDPSGGHVVVNGKASGDAPVELRLVAEPVVVAVSANGFEPAERRITLRGGETEDLSLSLRPMPSSLRIDVVPGAEVTVDGKDMGKAPLPPIHRPAGPVDISVNLNGHETLSRHLVLVAGEEHMETFRFLTDLPVEKAHGPPSFGTWIVASAVGGGAMLATGVIASAWRTDRTSTYDTHCLGAPEAGCDATLNEFHAAEALQISSFILAGALGGTALTLWILDRGADTHRAAATLRCSPSALVGLACGGAF